MAESGKQVVTLRVLQLANGQRNAYGLRYNDYNRYRKHCANRTHRLRSSLKIAHGKGRDFKKLPPLNLDNVKDGHLQLLLFEAERAWSYSVKLQNEALLPANDERAGTLRHSATGRFRRAVNWSTQLLSHCQNLYAASRFSAGNLLEVTIYTLILNGRFLRFRDDFEEALVQLSVARGLLDVLISSAATSHDQALATFFSDEIAPEIRYSAHELGRAKAYEVDSIVVELTIKHRKELVEGCDDIIKKFKSENEVTARAGAKRKLKELIWEGQPVPTRNPELVDVLLKVQDAEARLEGRDVEIQGEHTEGKKLTTSATISSKRGVAAYDAILSALSDAEDVARKLVETQHQGGSTSAGASSAPGARDLQFVHAFIVYQLLSRRIQRDLLLLSALLVSGQDPKFPGISTTGIPLKVGRVDARLYPAVVKLLDSALQSLEQMRSLTIVEDSPDLASAIDGRIFYTKARRCLYLSQCYSPLKRYAEALLLIQHAHIHIRETNHFLSQLVSSPASPSDLSSTNPKYFSLDTSIVQQLITDLDDHAFQYKRDWFAYNGGVPTHTPDGTSLANKQQTNKKALFFNIALNYVELDMDALTKRAGKLPDSFAAAPVPSGPAPMAAGKAPASTRAAAPTSTTKGEKKKVAQTVSKPGAPMPQQEQHKEQQRQQSKSGLGGLLGGWWGKS